MVGTSGANASQRLNPKVGISSGSRSCCRDNGLSGVQPVFNLRNHLSTPESPYINYRRYSVLKGSEGVGASTASEDPNGCRHKKAGEENKPHLPLYESPGKKSQ